jgi:hypothetical protein
LAVAAALLAVSIPAGSTAAPAPATQPGSVRMRERTASTELSLISDGRAACAVIFPAEDSSWSAMARDIAGAITRLGVAEVPVVPDTQAVPDRLGPLRPDLRDRTLILVGDLNTNRAMLPLYACYHTCCDARYPGGKGYELRTVVRPSGRPCNWLVVGASTRGGATVGVRRLIDRIGKLEAGRNVALPYTLEVRLGGEWLGVLAPAVRELEARTAGDGREAPVSTVEEFTRNAHLYFYSGDERFARRARDAAVRMAGAAERSGEPGFAVGDYTLENLACAWRRVSCSPAFSSRDRLVLDGMLYDTAVALSKAWWRIPPEKGIGNRHQSTGGLAWWTLIRNLVELSEPSEPARAQFDRWLAEGSAYCDGLLRHYWDDEDDYQSADSAQNAASYALQSGRMDWSTGGLARRAAQRLVMTVDNMGWYAGIQGYGDALPGWERFPLDAGLLLGACGFVYEDGSYLGVLDRFPTLRDSWGSLQPWGLHQFAAGARIAPRPPEWATGMRVARFTPYKLNRINSGEFMTTSIMDNFRPAGFEARPVPEALAFDKLCYRGGLAPTDPYLLLEGSSGTTLTTIDMNAIIRCTDAGKLWLVHNTGRRSLYFKNAVYVGRGTNQIPMAPSSELVASGDFGSAVLAASRLPDCRGMIWTRNLLIVRDRFAAVIDHLRAREEGDYTLSCNWRTPAWADIRDGRWQAMQDDVTFSIIPAVLDGADSDRPFLRDGATRPTTLRENRSLKAKPGDEVVFENVLYTATPVRPRVYDVRRIGPGLILVRDVRDGSPFLAGAGDHGIAMADLKSDAAALLITPAEVFAIGGKRVEFAGRNWDTSAGRVAVDPQDSTRIRSALERFWSAAPARTKAPAAVPATDASVSPGAAVAWTQPGPAVRGALVDGIRFSKGRQVEGLSLLATDWIMPLLRAEPRLMGRQQSELIRESREEQAAAIPEAEPVLSPLKGAEFSIDLPVQCRISDIDIFGDTLGETAEALPPGVLRVEMTFSSDGFRTDRRVRRFEMPRRPTFHNLYKGHCYLFECYGAAGVGEEASAIRVRVLDGPGNRLVITDLQVRSPEPGRRVPVDIRAIDLDGDGADEVLTWTADGDLAVIHPDGTTGWRYHVPEGILAVDAWDLEKDGKREIFVSRLDRQVNVFNADGSPRWNRDYRVMRQQTQGKFFGDGAAVYGMAVWNPATAAEPEVFFTSYWFTTRLTPAGEVREVFRRGGHFAQIRAVPARLPGAGGLAIRCEVPWPGNVPLEWWDPATGRPLLENAVPNGRSVFFELDDYDADGQVEALTASEQGIGMYAPRQVAALWEQMTDAPPVGVGIVRSQPGRPATIAYGRQDGYVFVTSADGKVLSSVILDEPLQCLTATGGARPTVWVGTRSTLRGLRLSDLSSMWSRPGSFQTLITRKIGGDAQVLGVTVSGGVTAFAAAQP